MTPWAREAALEALAAGDTAEATAILLSAQEDARPRHPRHSCSVCRAAFAWPGLLAKHYIVSGHGEQEVAA